MVLLTDNRVLVDNLRELPAIMCVQRKAEKKIPTEEDVITSNMNSFGDEIGKITNRITSMFEVQSHYEPGSREYEILDYRIKSGQLYQQNAIDRAKGIISKPMPREWYDPHSALEIPDEEEREFYLSILADKKPYFMRYIYPDLMKEYNTYIKNTEKKAQREFSLSVSDLLAKDDSELTEREREFLHYYKRGVPVGTGDCVMNRICRRFEEEFDGCLARLRLNSDYDYGILKRGIDYPTSKYYKIKKLYDEYSIRTRDYAAYVKRERTDSDAALAHSIAMRDEFRRLCANESSNGDELCEIVVDMCYKSGGTKSFAWGMCASDIIAELLSKNDGEICYPVEDSHGDVEFGGKNFSFHTKKIG